MKTEKAPHDFAALDSAPPTTIYVVDCTPHAAGRDEAIEVRSGAQPSSPADLVGGGRRRTVRHVRDALRTAGRDGSTVGVGVRRATLA